MAEAQGLMKKELTSADIYLKGILKARFLLGDSKLAAKGNKGLLNALTAPYSLGLANSIMSEKASSGGLSLDHH